MSFKAPNSVGRFVKQWLQAKLSVSGSQPSLTKGIVSLATVSGKSSVSLQMVADKEQELPVLAPNCESALNGVSGLLYHAAYFGDEYNNDERYIYLNSLYWNSLSVNLKAFLRLLPKYANVPLLVLFWQDEVSSFERLVF